MKREGGEVDRERKTTERRERERERKEENEFHSPAPAAASRGVAPGDKLRFWSRLEKQSGRNTTL